MATLTATLDTGPRNPDFHKGIITGSFDTTDNEGSGNGTTAVDQIVLLPTTCVIASFVASCEDGAGTLRAEANKNSADTDTNGTVKIESNCIGNQTFRFVATFFGS